MLLSDIRDVFTTRGCDRISSIDLATDLGGMEGRPWPEWSHGKPISQNQIARLLAPFKMKPKTIRMATGTPKGYEADAFTDAFARYLPEPSATPQQAKKTAGFDADQNAPEAAENNDCGGVADEEPAFGRRVRV
jgi:hypothetical protein